MENLKTKEVSGRNIFLRENGDSIEIGCYICKMKNIETKKIEKVNLFLHKDNFQNEVVSIKKEFDKEPKVFHPEDLALFEFGFAD